MPQRTRSLRQWYEDIILSGHSLRRQLVTAVALTTFLAGSIFFAVDYTRERDFFLDAAEQVVASRLRAELLQTDDPPDIFWERLVADDTNLLRPMYLQQYAIDTTRATKIPTNRITLGDAEQIPIDLTRYRRLHRRDTVAESEALIRGELSSLRLTRFWDDRVELHLVAPRHDRSAMVRIGFSIPGLDLHLIGSYLRNALWLLISSAVAALVLYITLSIWLVRRIRMLSDGFRELEMRRRAPRLPEDRQDELGLLFQRFNQFAAEVERTGWLRSELADERRARAEQEQQHQDTLDQTRIANAEQTFAALGRLSSGIAHEINNPLTFIRGAIVPLQKKLEPIVADLPEEEAKPLRELLDAVKIGVDRATQIVEDMRRLSSAGGMATEIDLGASLQRAIRLTGWMHKSARTLSHDIQPNITVLAPAGLLLQVWTNLIANAVEATENGGKIHVSVTYGDDHTTAIICVEDDGPGVPEQDRDTIFEPFATSKERGTGLGLALARTVVQEASGKLSVTSSKLGGARFCVEFPVHKVNKETTP